MKSQSADSRFDKQKKIQNLKIQEMKEMIRFLENEVSTLEDQIKEFLNQEVKTFQDGKYTNEVIAVYEDLLC